MVPAMNINPNYGACYDGDPAMNSNPNYGFRYDGDPNYSSGHE